MPITTLGRLAHIFISPSVLVPVIGYEIETAVGPGGPFQLATRIESNFTRYSLGGLLPGNLYRFRIRSLTHVGKPDHGLMTCFTEPGM